MFKKIKIISVTLFDILKQYRMFKIKSTVT